MNADRHLLFGLLALQNEFIDKRQLVAAFGVWMADHQKPLDEILVVQGAIKEDDRALLSRLVDRHVAVRGGDVAASLRSLSGADSVREELQQLHDRDVQSSVAKLRELDQTVVPSVGQVTSSGQRFEIRRPLDRGGLGIVSVAVDKEFNREVALKEIRSDRADDQSYRNKFLLEAEVTGGLEHPGIVPVYGLGMGPDGRPYYAMRLIKGDNLLIHIKRFHERIRAGKEEFDGAALRQLLRRFLDVCQAIDYAHARGVLHRDLKPGNVMLGKFGETLVVDWGLAKPLGAKRAESASPAGDGDAEPSLVPSGSASDMTLQGSIVGTASYAPPEQLSGDLHLVNERSDIYGLGAMLYELLTGQAPARGDTLEAIIKAAIAGDIKAPRDVQSKVPKPLQAICLRAIAVRPEDRYASAAELGDEIERWLDDLPVHAFPEPATLRAKRWMRAHPSIVATTAVMVLMAVLGLTLFSSVVAQHNQSLADLNQTLDHRNRELTAANEREAAARQLAEEQSELALATLTRVVFDIQRGVKNLPGGSDVRRRLLQTSLAQLTEVANELVAETAVNQTTMAALLDIGEVVLRFDEAADEEAIGGEPSQEQQHAIALATSLYKRAAEIPKVAIAKNPDDVLAQRNLSVAYLRLGNVSAKAGNLPEASQYYQQAKDISEKLVRLDPADQEAQRDLAVALHFLGSVALQSGNIEEAREMYKQGLEVTQALVNAAPSSAVAQRDLATCYEKLGELSYQQGQMEEAARHFDRLAELCQSLAAADPDDLQAQRDLAISFDKLGNLHLQSDQTQKALEFYRQGLEISRRLVSLDQGDLQAKRDLSIALDNLAKISLREGRLAESLELYQNALDISQQLSQADPTNAQAKRDLMISFNNLGFVNLQMGQIEEAKSLYQQGLDGSQELASEYPENAQALRDLSISFNQLGDISLLTNEVTEATEFYSQAMRIREKLAKRDSTDTQSQRDLTVSLDKLGDVSIHAAEFQKAFDYYQKAFEVREKLSLINPTHLQAKRDLSLSFNNVGHVKLLLGETADALKAYEQGLMIDQQLADSDTADAQAQRDLATAYDRLGDLNVQLAKYPEALAHYRRGLEISQRLAEASPTDLAAQRDLSITLNNLGFLCMRLGRLSDALGYFQQSYEISERLSRIDEGNRQAQRDLAVTSNHLGNVYLQLGRTDEALGRYEFALEICKRLSEQDPTDSLAKHDLIFCHRKLANAQTVLQLDAAASDHYRAAIAVADTSIQQEVDVQAMKAERVQLAAALEDAESRELAMREWSELLSQPEEKLGKMLSFRGLRLAQTNDCDGALQAARRLLKLQPVEPIDLYAAARVFASCATAPARSAEREPLLVDAVTALQKAIAAGYQDFDSMREEADFAPLRERADYRALFPAEAPVD